MSYEQLEHINVENGEIVNDSVMFCNDVYSDQWSLEICHAITGAISIISSLLIIYMISKIKAHSRCDTITGDRQPLKPVQKFLLIMSFIDIIVCSYIYIYWGAIRRTIYPETATPYQKETTIACQMTGFIRQMSFSVPCYNGAICLYFLLLVKFNISAEKFTSTGIEQAVHVICLGYPISTAIAALFMGLYNDSGAECWMAPFPKACHNDKSIKCIRGENAFLWAWLFAGLQLLFLFIFITVSMIVVFNTLRQGLEEIKHNTSLHNSSYSSKLQEASIQSIIYSLSFFITWVFPICVKVVDQLHFRGNYFLVLLAHCMLPLQGFWNFLAFVNPKVYVKKRSNPNKSMLSIWREVIFGSSDRPSQNRNNIRRQRESSLSDAAISPEKELNLSTISDFYTSSYSGEQVENFSSVVEKLGDSSGSGKRVENVSFEVEELSDFSDLRKQEDNFTSEVGELRNSSDSRIQEENFTSAKLGEYKEEAYQSDNKDEIKPKI